MNVCYRVDFIVIGMVCLLRKFIYIIADGFLLLASGSLKNN